MRIYVLKYDKPVLRAKVFGVLHEQFLVEVIFGVLGTNFDDDHCTIAYS